MAVYTITLNDEDDAKLKEVYSVPEDQIKAFICGSIDTKKRQDSVLATVLTDPDNILVEVS